MDALSDDDFERVSDVDISDYESDPGLDDNETPSSTPPSTRIFRASDLKTIPCTYAGCSKTFNRRARLEEHLRSHTNSRIFKCDHEGCDKDFLRETHLKHHVKSAHSNIRDYKCTWEGCDKSFATGTRLKRHLQAHEGREKYRCRGYENCDQTFRKHDTLRRHILQVHEQMKPFPCNNIDAKTGRPCDKAFDTAEKLRVHVRTKHDNTRFSCTECLSFNAQGAESVSALTTKQFDVFFPTYSDLQAHIAEFHPPTCPYCPTSFKTSKELKRHLEIQHDVVDLSKPKIESHHCTYPGCDRSFTKKGNLNVHIKTVHEQKKDFVCGETEIILPIDLCPNGPVEVYGCGRAFTTKASLEDHVRTAHLGVTSLQVERKNKRKAEKRETEIDTEPKPRKPRKDKGVKKTSIMESLTGSAILPHGRATLPLDPALANPYHQSPPPRTQTAYQEGCIKTEPDDDEDDDEWNQLSGSMILLDDRLYHHGEQYEYTANQYPPGLTPPSLHSSQVSRPDSSAGYSRVNPKIGMTVDDEPFFDGFEHEPESMSGDLNLRRTPIFGTNY